MRNIIRPLTSRTKINIVDLISVFSMGLLVTQVFLLVILTRRIIALEKYVFQFFISGPIPRPVLLDRVPDERGFALGPMDAVVTLVGFSDFECPYCATAATDIKELIKKYPDRVRYVYRHFPLTEIHSNAFRAAIAAECAGEQSKFWDMHDLLFIHQEELDPYSLTSYAGDLELDIDQFRKCVDSGRMKAVVKQDVADGNKYGVDGTPTLFVNKKMVMSVGELEGAVVEALATP